MVAAAEQLFGVSFVAPMQIVSPLIFADSLLKCKPAATLGYRRNALHEEMGNECVTIRYSHYCTAFLVGVRKRS